MTTAPLPVCFALTLVALAATASPRAVVGQGSGRTAVHQLTSTLLKNTRTIRIHYPPGYDLPVNRDRRYRVLYMNDGFAVFNPRSWNAPGIVDSLIQIGAIEPMVLVGVDNAASIPGSTNPGRDRTTEYLPYLDPLEPEVTAPKGLQYAEFLIGEVFPLVAANARVRDDREGIVLGGASYGGIAALVTSIRHPQRIGGLILESTPTFLFGGRLVHEAGQVSPPIKKLHIGIGGQETTDSTILAAARRSVTLEEVIAQRAPGVQIQLIRVDSAGHNSAAWRERLPAALVFHFKTP